jgi:NDP-sugar pyrophosphorylase family protein
LFLIESRSDFGDFSEVLRCVLAQVSLDALKEIGVITILPEQPIYWPVPDAKKTTVLPPLALLAGGLATRMRPITATIPKSMIEVAGEPFIAHQLRLLVRQGVTDVVVCGGYLGEQIEAYVGDGAEFGCHVRYSYDGQTLLGTGGAVACALPMLGQEFFVMYGDSYLKADLRAMYAAFRAARHPAMMAVFRNQGRWDTSNVEFADGMVRVYDKDLRSEAMHYIDYGVGLFTAGLFEGRAGAFDLAEIYREEARRGELRGWEAKERFYEIGSPSGLAELNGLLEKGRTI